MFAFQPQPVEDGHAIFKRHQFEGAAALLLEGLLDLGTGSPLGGEGVVGVDGEGVYREGLGTEQAGGDQQQGFHERHSLAMRCQRMRAQK